MKYIVLNTANYRSLIPVRDIIDIVRSTDTITKVKYSVYSNDVISIVHAADAEFFKKLIVATERALMSNENIYNAEELPVVTGVTCSTV
jgi:deoxyribose-phosphate aldolase